MTNWQIPTWVLIAAPIASFLGGIAFTIWLLDGSSEYEYEEYECDITGFDEDEH